MALSWQGSLFDEPREISRNWLDERCWLDHAPHWLPDHATLLAQLLAEAPRQQRQRRLWDQTVWEPRQVAVWTTEPLPPRLEHIRVDLSQRYDAEFDSVLVNLYRDGQDAVAWHADTVRHRLPEAIVVTLALGERRPFLLRPGCAGPATRRFATGEGDLLVMGGRTQHEWQHTVPRRAAVAGMRMSVTMRHSGAC